ncbi:MAG: hypothetical protein ACYTBR_14515, partial [Planctomycetota bacterium]
MEKRTPNGSRLLPPIAPFCGTVAVIASWFIAIPRMRSAAEDLGVELPLLTRVLVDHAGLITTVALVVAVLGITAIGLARRRSTRIFISAVTSIILFAIAFWDLIVFYLIYGASLYGI